MLSSKIRSGSNGDVLTMNRFIRKNLFLVGVLAISAVGVLILLGLSAVKFFEMNKYLSETEKMTQALEELNNRMRTPIPPFRKNVKLVQEDTEGYKNLKKGIQNYFGQVLYNALTVFVTDLHKQSMEKLISLAEMFDKTSALANLKKEFAAANAAWQKSITAVDKCTADLKKAYKDIKRVEEDEATQEDKARVVTAQQQKIAGLRKQLDDSIAARSAALAAVDAAYGNVLAHISREISSEVPTSPYRLWVSKNKEDAKEFDFYYNICRQNLTVDSLCDTFREYWNNTKDLQGPRKKTYLNFRLERGATLDQSANSKNKPALWDTEMWDIAIEKFVKEAQKSIQEKIDEKNFEEIFLASMGLLRNLDKKAALMEAHANKMRKLVEEKLESNNVFITGVNFSQTALEQIKSNKGFVDSGSTRTGNTSTQTSGSTETAGSTMFLTADPSDVVRSWDVIGDITDCIVTANISQLEKFSYVNLAGDSSNSNYKKYSYVITLVSRESQIRTLLQLLADSYKRNRMYVIKRFSMQKQEDQIQDIIDYASGIIGKEDNNQSSNTSADDNKNLQSTPAYFKETGNYPECVAGRSTLCRVTLVVDYVETTGNQLK